MRLLGLKALEIGFANIAFICCAVQKHQKLTDRPKLYDYMLRVQHNLEVVIPDQVLA